MFIRVRIVLSPIFKAGETLFLREKLYDTLIKAPSLAKRINIQHIETPGGLRGLNVFDEMTKSRNEITKRNDEIAER